MKDLIMKLIDKHGNKVVIAAAVLGAIIVMVMVAHGAGTGALND